MIRTSSLRGLASIVFVAAGTGCVKVPTDNNTPPPAWTDTKATSPEAQVYRTWVQYIDSKHGRYSANSQVPSPFWVADEQRNWPAYDMAMSYVPDSAAYMVTAIAPTDTTGRPAQEFRVTTRFASRAGGALGACGDTILSITTFATRADSGWRFSSALPRFTRDWSRNVAGPVTFIVDPALHYDARRASKSAVFVDSVSMLLGFGHPAPLTYYVARSIDVVCEIQGIHRTRYYGAAGGVTAPWNRQVFSGNPNIGEGYLHELVHLVVQPLMTGQSTYLATEGVPIWLGGSGGRSFADLHRLLADYLAQHPSSTLDSIMDAKLPITLGNAFTAEFISGAVLSQLVFEQAGTPGLKRFLDASSNAEVRTALTAALHKPWTTIAQEWRANAMHARETQ